MFGKKKSVKNPAGVTTLIARNTRVKGTVHFSGVLEIEGHIDGDIYAEKDSESVIRILQHGRVDGEVVAPEVIVNGHVKGDVHSSVEVYLASKAVVEGNVYYSVIDIEKGAQLSGNMVFVDEGKVAPSAAMKTEQSQPVQDQPVKKSFKQKNEEHTVDAV